MLFIGPSLLSGIGQQCKKYMGLFPGSQYIELQNDIPVCERAFIYALPVPHWLDKIPEIKRKIKRIRKRKREQGNLHERREALCRFTRCVLACVFL